MPTDPTKPRNHDQELPSRTGEGIESTVPPKQDRKEHREHTPLPEEETYERESPTRQRKN
jgi:hypothetical protein